MQTGPHELSFPMTISPEVPPRGIVRCRPGEEIHDPRPGDIILIRTGTWLGTFIRFFERLRYHTPADRPFAYWSHAALVVTNAGHLIEVAYAGVTISRIERYRRDEYHYVRLDLTEPARTKAVALARSCLKQKYGHRSFLLLALALLLGDRFQVPDNGEQGCVALIVRALQAAGMSFDRGPADMMPADLAKRFGVTP
jgi:hypothetical protein